LRAVIRRGIRDRKEKENAKEGVGRKEPTRSGCGSKWAMYNEVKRHGALIERKKGK